MNGNYTGKAYLYLSSFPDNRKNLLLFGAIQGMYDPVSNTEIPDTVKIYLRNSAAPYAIVDSSKNLLLGPGTGQNFIFRNVRNGLPYFVVVKHRNALETWSGSLESFNGNILNYDFTVSANKAYGNNLIQIGTRYSIYSGDVNNDGSIELSDLLQTSNAANNFITGYFTEDINGDQIADLSDISLVYNNASNFIMRSRP